MFKILIKNLNLFGYHGVREEEKRNGQNFRFNVEVSLNKDNLVKNDCMEDTLNYSEMINIIKDINNQNRFNLLETLSKTIAGRIMDMSPMIGKVKVRVEKTAPPIKENLGSVGVEYVLDRKSAEGAEESKPGKSKIDVFMSLGSNMGKREDNLRRAVDLIGKSTDIDILKVSSIYETEPMYVKDQDFFYNIVLLAKVNEEVNPFKILGFLKGIEFSLGGKRDKRYGPRVIDIDLLYYGGVSIESDFLTIPHPKIAERKFVLVPLGEIAPEFKIKGKSIKKVIDEGKLTEKVTLVKDW